MFTFLFYLRWFLISWQSDETLKKNLNLPPSKKSPCEVLLHKYNIFCFIYIGFLFKLNRTKYKEVDVNLSRIRTQYLKNKHNSRKAFCRIVLFYVLSTLVFNFVKIKWKIENSELLRWIRIRYLRFRSLWTFCLTILIFRW